MRQASMVYGPVQAAIARAVQDAVEEGILTMESMERDVALVEVSVDPDAVDRRAIYTNTYAAAMTALRKMRQ